MPGVVGTTVGYAGGTTPQPEYRAMGDHTETLRVEYDPARIGYDALLEVFWSLHDPMSQSHLRQYRNVVFYLDAEQKRQIEVSAERIRQRTGRPVNTAIEPAGVFTAAEDYHQKYYLRGADRLLQGLRGNYPDEKSLIASTAAVRINGFLGCHGDPETLATDIAALGLPETMQLELLEYLTLRCRNFRGVPCNLPRQ
ncbi:peptide methionine sulfoxide reductase [Geothermobacter hydrogeniphilus]|uniref:peptide-methionine (S)-S-oxide reductase n=1 Tax=Geothermobacter hydrogeniphilus TaxID=1969733 RepID=A0A2K2HDY6_9BACT|nr:peptide methionine sulfoxide reductase [Geothermobacter hydrogeniphilus]